MSCNPDSASAGPCRERRPATLRRAPDIGGATRQLGTYRPRRRSARRSTAVWEEWLDEASVALRPLTVTAYRHAFAHRIVPLLGEHVVSEIGRRDVLALIRALQRDSLAAWTIRGTLVPLGLFLTWTIDQGWRTGNPVLELRRNERPRISRKQHRNLTADEIWQLIEAAAPDRRAFVALLGFAGLRTGEALGLSWADVDFDRRLLHVRAQLERGTHQRVEPKTPRALRTIELDDGLLRGAARLEG